MNRSIIRVCLLIPALLCISPFTGRCLTLKVAANGDIQAAIDSVAAAGGGVVNIGSGTAGHSTTLRMKSKVTLNGAGNPTTTLTTIGDITLISTSSDGLSNVILQNIKLSGNGGTGSTSNCGYIIASLSTHHNAITASNVQLQNFGGIACHYKRADNSTITGCNFHDSGADVYSHNLYIRECTSTNVAGTNLSNSPFGSGFHLAGSTTGGSIKTSTLNSNGEDGMNIQDSPSNYTVDGCTANSNRNATAGRSDGIGVNAQTGTGSVKNCTATGNRVNYQVGGGYAQSNNH